MAGETVKRNLHLPPSISPAIVAKLIIQILECKRSSCKCETSKEILHFAMKILLSEDDSSLYSDHKFRTITKFSSCAGTKNVATQTRRCKRNSCTIQTDSETVIPKKSISVQTEKTRFKLLQSKLKQRISNGSTKSVSTQANLLEFVNVANKENIENILQDDMENTKHVENSDDKMYSEKSPKKEKNNKRLSRVTYFHGKKLIEKGSKKSPFHIPLTCDKDTELSDPRLKNRDCLKLWNPSALWNVSQNDEEPEMRVQKLIDEETVETKVKEVINIFPLDFHDEVGSHSSIGTTDSDVANYVSQNKRECINRSHDKVTCSPEDCYSKLNEITNIDFDRDLENDESHEAKAKMLDVVNFTKKNVCKDPRLKGKNCLYNSSNVSGNVVAATNKSRRVTITEGMPLQGISAEAQKVQHLDECFCNWAPRQACPSDPRIKLRCGNVNLDYRNPKRDISYNNAELPLKKQKIDYDPMENELFSSRKAEEIRTPPSATPEFSPASIESMYDSIKHQENNNSGKLEKTSCFHETVSEAASRKVNEIEEKLGIKDRICSESFQHSYLRLNNEKTNHVPSNKVCDSAERQHLKLSPERLNSPPVSTISSASLNQQSENLNKFEDFDSKCSNLHENESSFNETKSSLKEANFINIENGEKTQSMLPYKMEYCANLCKLDKNTAKVQKEVTKDASSDDYSQHGIYLNEKHESEQTLQKECSLKDVNKVSYQKPNTLNCKRDSQDSGISEHNVLDKESIEVYSPTDELSMCSDMEVSYTPPVHPSSPDRSPLLDFDSDKNAAVDAENDTTVSSKELPNFDKIPEYTTQDIIESANAKPDQQKGESEMIQNYAFMKNWMNCMPQWFQQQALSNYYKWYRDGTEMPTMHYQTFYPPYSNNYLSEWICYPWWNGNAAGWH
ncbi:uncharacterized protein [Centruroides vittatus]|uniref:uncharacterized protein n=1 Tax=Centruroides vittatus TaxID=120091 RepID=UPI0035106FB7